MKRTAKTLLIALMALVLVGSFSACSQLRDAKAIADALKSAAADISAAANATPDAEETTAPEESAAPDETAAEEETATPAKGGKPGYWPDDINSDVPAFKYGAYDDTNESKLDVNDTLMWALTFNEVTKDNVEEYLQTLKGKGYETFSGTADGDMTFGGTLKKDGKDYITVLGGWTGDTGVCTLAVTYPSK